MSAHDALGSQFTLYHGSNEDFPEGHELVPGSVTRKSISDKVWMTTDRAEAASYGKHVYEVQADDPTPRPVQGRYTAPRAKVVRKA